MGRIGFTPCRSAAVRTVAPCGGATLIIVPAAMGLRTKRTQWLAGRSAVNRPAPATSAGSSTRRIERPTQVEPEPRVAALMRSRAPKHDASPPSQDQVDRLRRLG